jgi:hypothetical protein
MVASRWYRQVRSGPQKLFDQCWHDPIIDKTYDCLLRKYGAGDFELGLQAQSWLPLLFRLRTGPLCRHGFIYSAATALGASGSRVYAASAAQSRTNGTSDADDILRTRGDGYST